jgi:signal transduction histidine kinase
VRLLVGGAISLVLLVVAFLFVLRLVQRTRRLENEAQRAEQLAYLGTLASGLAHEIRNPLNAMNINMQMLEEELAGKDTAEPTLDLLRSARGEVLRLERLVKDFLAFARPQASRMEDIAPGALVADVVRFVRPLFAGRGVELELIQAPGAPIVRIDAGQIRQALLNILQNALEASPRGKTVAVTVGATPRGEARIEIHDEGPGIPRELLPRVFEVFWSRKPAGSGLGLPIAQRVVEAHGGRIEVDSREGSGSVFRIVLPAALAATAAETSGAAS